MIASAAVVVYATVVFVLAREALPNWDKQIQSLCFQVNSIIEKIGVAEPEWLAKTLDDDAIA